MCIHRTVRGSEEWTDWTLTLNLKDTRIASDPVPHSALVRWRKRLSIHAVPVKEFGSLRLDARQVVYRAIVRAPNGERGVYFVRSDADDWVMTVFGSTTAAGVSKVGSTATCAPPALVIDGTKFDATQLQKKRRLLDPCRPAIWPRMCGGR